MEKGKNNDPGAEEGRIEMKSKLYGLVLRATLKTQKVPLREGNAARKICRGGGGVEDKVKMAKENWHEFPNK